jgi:hypothetical protein
MGERGGRLAAKRGAARVHLHLQARESELRAQLDKLRADKKALEARAGGVDLPVRPGGVGGTRSGDAGGAVWGRIGVERQWRGAWARSRLGWGLSFVKITRGL